MRGCSVAGGARQNRRSAVCFAMQQIHDAADQSVSQTITRASNITKYQTSLMSLNSPACLMPSTKPAENLSSSSFKRVEITSAILCTTAGSIAVDAAGSSPVVARGLTGRGVSVRYTVCASHRSAPVRPHHVTHVGSSLHAVV